VTIVAPIRLVSVANQDGAAIARFWSRVDKNGPVPPHRPELGPCWLWTGYRMPRGYGQATIFGKRSLTHRASWRIATGQDAGALFVCHHCDNPSCVRPEHLFLGTHQDNTDDMMAKGRGPVGDRNGARKYPQRISASEAYQRNRPRGPRVNTAVLTYEDVGRIRAMFVAGLSNKEIALEFGVHRNSIWHIRRGLTWKS
jgi:hypothetical protein